MNAKQRRKARRGLDRWGDSFASVWRSMHEYRGQQYAQPVIYGVSTGSFHLWRSELISVGTIDAAESVRRMFRRETGRDL